MIRETIIKKDCLTSDCQTAFLAILFNAHLTPAGN